MMLWPLPRYDQGKRDEKRSRRLTESNGVVNLEEQGQQSTPGHSTTRPQREKLPERRTRAMGKVCDAQFLSLGNEGCTDLIFALRQLLMEGPIGCSQNLHPVFVDQARNAFD